MCPTPFPDWIQNRLVRDRLFQQAYDRVPPERRAVLKTCIARLHALMGQENCAVRRESAVHSSGAISHVTRRPVAWSLLLLNEEAVSPVRVLAAALPPLLAGVEHVLVARMGKARGRAPWSDAVLTGLELAGIEMVADLSPRAASSLLLEMADSGSMGVVLCPDSMEGVSREAGLCLAESPNIRFWKPRPVTELAVFFPEDADDADWDCELIRWAHPDVPLLVWSRDADAVPEYCHPGAGVHSGSVAEFQSQEYDYVFMPGSGVDFSTSASLTLPPGFEGSWFWPGLRQDFFHTEALAWGVTSPWHEE